MMTNPLKKIKREDEKEKKVNIKMKNKMKIHTKRAKISTPY